MPVLTIVHIEHLALDVLHPTESATVIVSILDVSLDSFDRIGKLSGRQRRWKLQESSRNLQHFDYLLRRFFANILTTRQLCCRRDENFRLTSRNLLVC